MVPRWRLFGDFLRDAFSASRVQHVSDLRLKFALKAIPCVEVWQTSSLRRLRLGQERKKEERTNDRMKIYMACPIIQDVITFTGNS